MILNSYAKLNLYLEVLGKRRDRYHNIKTLFERIDLADKIVLKSRRDKKIKIICKSPRVPQDKRNLCYRSAKLLQDEFRVNQGAEIKIIKRIPVGSGLGGGSSNAAVALLGLNKIWKLGLARVKLAALAKKIGSDVPFFIYDCPFAEGTNRGDRIKPIAALNKVRLWQVLVAPGIKVPTPLIYRKWDKVRSFKLTRPKYGVKILNLALKKFNLPLIGDALFNGLETVTARWYPQVGQIKETLARLGVKSILMSGSGPAVFGIVSSRKEAVALSKQLKVKNRPWQVFVARTV